MVSGCLRLGPPRSRAGDKQLDWEATPGGNPRRGSQADDRGEQSVKVVATSNRGCFSGDEPLLVVWTRPSELSSQREKETGDFIPHLPPSLAENCSGRESSLALPVGRKGSVFTEGHFWNALEQVLGGYGRAQQHLPHWSPGKWHCLTLELSRASPSLFLPGGGSTERH